MSFEKDFLRGVASLVAQIEGGADKDSGMPRHLDTFPEKENVK